MGSYYGFVITNDGYELIAKLVAGQKLAITKVMVGSGSLPEGAKPRALKNLVEPIANGTSTEPKYDKATVSLTIEYRSDMNGGLAEGFWLREYGIFANDPDKGEVLIYYGTLGDYPQYVCAASSTGVDVRRFPVSIIIGEGLGVTVDYNTEAWMTAEDVREFCSFTLLPELLQKTEECIEKHEENENAHPKLLESFGELLGQHEQNEEAHLDLRKEIEDLEKAIEDQNKDEVSVTMYASLEEIGLTTGKETIDGIVQALKENCELFYATGTSNASIYPGVHGLVKAICKDSSNTRFQWTDRATGVDYVGVYCAANSTKWVGWKKVGSDITLEGLGAVAKAGDTMEGVLKAGSDHQTADDYLVRNQKLRQYTTEAELETPSVSGAICWHYE